MRIMPITTNYAANNIRFRGEVAEGPEDNSYYDSYYRSTGSYPDNMYNNLRTTTFAIVGNTLILYGKDGSKIHIDLTDKEEMLNALKRIQ